MELGLHTLAPNAGSRKKKKRVGRGNASGHGTTATRGTKGQRARSGVSGLKLKGFRQNLLQMPKLRGFKSLREKPAILSVAFLEKKFENGSTITPELLAKKGYVRKKEAVKILNVGEITKKFTLKGLALSKAAREKIEKAGGKVL